MKPPCVICGAVLGKWQAKYCSQQCQNKATVQSVAYQEAQARARGRLRPKTERICTQCGATWWVDRNSPSRYCSLQCAMKPRQKPKPPKPPRQVHTPRPKPVQFRQERQCQWCEATFTATSAHHVYCCKDHKHRAMKVRRRGNEHGWASNYTWAEVTRLFLTFNRCCAYCDQPIDGQPDPDHVVPLSRGGSNSLTNILPSCRRCNGDKRDLLLHEWEVDRARRGLPPRTTRWAPTDQRFHHLTSVVMAA